MPNTKSAERRMRSSAKKQAHNRTVHTRLHTLERNYLELVGSGKSTEAASALIAITSALDKAAKTNKIHKSMASRKKSRLAIRLVKLNQPAAPAPVAPVTAKAA